MLEIRTRARPPTALVLPIIDACAGRCTMCGIWQRPHRQPLDPDVLLEILDDPALSAALTHVNVTGGEPVDHPQFAEIATALGRGCPALVEVSVNTSGLESDKTLAGIESFREALDRRLSMVATVSLDGLHGRHDRIRGVKGAFEETERSIDGLIALAGRRDDLRIHLNCTVSRLNCDGVDEVIAWARWRGVGLTLTAAAANDLYLGNERHQPRFELAPDQAVAFARLLDEVQDDKGFALTERNYYEMLAAMLRGSPRSSPCVYQSHGVFLDLDGTIYPCGTAGQLPYGRVPEDSFGEIYHGPAGDAVRRRLLAEHCPTCPTNSYHGLADGVWLKVLKRRRRGNGIEH